MKKMFIAVAWLFVIFPLFGQEHKVDFKLSKDFKVFREGDDKDYCVLNYGSDLGAEELQNKFYDKWNELHNLPPYFWGYPFEDSLFDTNTGILDGCTPLYSTMFGNVGLNYSYTLRFRDGRVRIDAPNINVVIQEKGDNSRHMIITPEEWCAMPAPAFTSHTKARELKRQFLEEFMNVVINQLLYDIDVPFENNEANPIEFDGYKTNYLKLGDEFKFVFSNGKNKIAFKMDGFSKEQLEDYIHEFITRLGGKSMNISSSVYDIGVYCCGKIEIPIALQIAKIPYQFEYQCLYRCEDNKIVVYVPRVTSVKYEGEKPYAYDDFKDALIMFGICDKKGTHKGSNKAISNIEAMEKYFNTICLGPLEGLRPKQNSEPELINDEW